LLGWKRGGQPEGNRPNQNNDRDFLMADSAALITSWADYEIIHGYALLGGFSAGYAAWQLDLLLPATAASSPKEAAVH